MRQSNDGRDTVPIWSYASTGERVYGAIDGCPGDVVSVDKIAGTFVVEWLDASGSGVSVVYPMDTIMVGKGFPWET